MTINSGGDWRSHIVEPHVLICTDVGNYVSHLFTRVLKAALALGSHNRPEIGSNATIYSFAVSGERRRHRKAADELAICHMQIHGIQPDQYMPAEVASLTNGQKAHTLNAKGSLFLTCPGLGGMPPTSKSSASVPRRSFAR